MMIFIGNQTLKKCTKMWFVHFKIKSNVPRTIESFYTVKTITYRFLRSQMASWSSRTYPGRTQTRPRWVRCPLCSHRYADTHDFQCKHSLCLITSFERGLRVLKSWLGRVELRIEHFYTKWNQLTMLYNAVILGTKEYHPTLPFAA